MSKLLPKFLKIEVLLVLGVIALVCYYYYLPNQQYLAAPIIIPQTTSTLYYIGGGGGGGAGDSDIYPLISNCVVPTRSTFLGNPVAVNFTVTLVHNPLGTSWLTMNGTTNVVKAAVNGLNSLDLNTTLSAGNYSMTARVNDTQSYGASVSCGWVELVTTTTTTTTTTSTTTTTTTTLNQYCVSGAGNITVNGQYYNESGVYGGCQYWTQDGGVGAQLRVESNNWTIIDGAHGLWMYYHEKAVDCVIDDEWVWSPMVDGAEPAPSVVFGVCLN